MARVTFAQGAPMHQDVTEEELHPRGRGRRTRTGRLAVGLVAGLALMAPGLPAAAQAPGGFGTCIPREQRGDRDVGCFIITDHALGAVREARAYWHVARLASRAEGDAALAATGGRGTVVEAFGDAWLLAVADSAWRPPRGTTAAVIGPLPLRPGVSYSALYIEASMRPGMKSAVHRHSGPEAWYTLSGETCLETPSGIQVGHAGGPPVIVPGGPPMELTATGTTLRRSLVLILHDASRPPTTMETSWKPRGLCAR